MSTYVKLINGKVIAEQNGLRPEGVEWVEVNTVVNYPQPKLYPNDFYYSTTNIPRRTIAGNVVTDTLNKELSSVESLQQGIYKQLKPQRKAKELAGFEYAGVVIPATQAAMIKIPELPPSLADFRVSDGVFIDVPDTAPLISAFNQHIQDCYKWEHEEVKKVIVADTPQKLMDYLNNE